MVGIEEKIRVHRILQVAVQIAELFGQEPPALLYEGPGMAEDNAKTITKCTELLKELPRVQEEGLRRWIHNGAYANMMQRGPVNRVNFL